MGLEGKKGMEDKEKRKEQRKYKMQPTSTSEKSQQMCWVKEDDMGKDVIRDKLRSKRHSLNSGTINTDFFILQCLPF